MKIPSSPLMVSFQITQMCNCSCLYCYNSPYSTQEHITLSDFRKVISDFCEKGVFSFSIEGGEPLLHPRFHEITQAVEETKIGYTILTNGTLIDLSTAQRFAQLNADIIVSLDSTSPDVHNRTRGLFESAIKGIHALLRQNVGFGINTVITKHNIDTCHEIIDEFYPHVTKFGFLRLIPRSRQDAIVKELLDYSIEQTQSLKLRLKNYTERCQNISIESPFNLSGDKASGFIESLNVPGCLAGTTFITVRPNLDVLPCSYCQNVVLGNLGIHTIGEIWHSEFAQAIRRSRKVPCLHDNWGVAHNESEV